MALVRPCKTSAAYEALPDRQGRLDMARVRAALEAAGFEILLDARIMLLVRGRLECTVYQTGRILMKTQDADAARAAYDELGPLLSDAWA